MKLNNKWLVIGSLLLASCASQRQKEIVDTGQNDSRPNWVKSSKVTWDEGDQVFFRVQYTVRGDERVNGCYQLAKLEVKESLLREIAEEIRVEIDNAQQSISENAEVILNQSRSSEYSGKVTGLRNLEQYHERYKIDGTERVDCFLLSAIKLADYEAIRKRVIYKMAEEDPELKKAMSQKQINFFTPKIVSEVVDIVTEVVKPVGGKE